MPELSNANTAVRPVVQVQRNAYAKLNGIQPQYQIVIDVQGDEALLQGTSVFPIIASLPERYSLNLSSQWDAPFANKSIGEAFGAFGAPAAASAVIDQGLTTIGIGTRNKYQLAQVWQSSSPVNFNLDLVFNAITNTHTDVRNKHISLLKLIVPSDIGAGVLQAPGPNLVASNLQGRLITLYLGTYLKIENVIVKNVGSDIQTICGEDGIPHSMTINVEFESFFAGTTTQDLDKMFGFSI